MPITYRQAQASEWPEVESAWRQCYPDPVPSPDITEVAVAEEDGRFVGFLFAQAVLHIGQFGIVPDKRGKQVSFGSLQEVLEKRAKELNLPGFITFSTVNRDQRMQELGYALPHWLVYRKFI